MFLYLLNDKESEAFLELAAKAMQVNGKEKDCELAVLDQFRLELGKKDYNLQGTRMSDLIDIFLASSAPAKRSAIIELSSILYADEEIDKKEKTWIVDLAKKIGVHEDETERLVSWSKNFNDFVKVGLMYINL